MDGIDESNIIFNKIYKILSYMIPWILGIYLLYLFINIKNPISYFTNEYNMVLLLIIIIILFLFPFLKKIKIKDVIEIEKEIEETRKDINDFKNEMRQTLNNIINISSNTSSSAKVIIGGSEDANLSLAKYFEKKPHIQREYINIKNQLDKTETEYFRIQEEDFRLKLLNLIIKIECLLRVILGKTLDSRTYKDTKFLSFYKLVNLFLQNNPDNKDLEYSLNYTRNIRNAAVHAQNITDSQAKEAIEICSKLIAVLEDIAKERNIEHSC